MYKSVRMLHFPLYKVIYSNSPVTQAIKHYFRGNFGLVDKSRDPNLQIGFYFSELRTYRRVFRGPDLQIGSLELRTYS